MQYMHATYYKIWLEINSKNTYYYIINFNNVVKYFKN